MPDRGAAAVGGRRRAGAAARRWRWRGQVEEALRLADREQETVLRCKVWPRTKRDCWQSCCDAGLQQGLWRRGLGGVRRGWRELLLSRQEHRRSEEEGKEGREKGKRRKRRRRRRRRRRGRRRGRGGGGSGAVVAMAMEWR
ncbi:hypothetical protein JCGZ_10388 [Jatropha curcas]|uniref:Uncharacterized protein n=1 Tax=Jatropha curcas TaxID=180498 RepID=A0A067KU71_JATCU|nr:hypothetical protein JCGZ_10388 [Jatropha curcas]